MKACNYLENLNRMRYDEYLAVGYPIASGAIEGTFRHLVKERMERSGMLWREPDAGVIAPPAPLGILPGVKYDFSVIAAALSVDEVQLPSTHFSATRHFRPSREIPARR